VAVAVEAGRLPPVDLVVDNPATLLAGLVELASQAVMEVEVQATVMLIGIYTLVTLVPMGQHQALVGSHTTVVVEVVVLERRLITATPHSREDEAVHPTGA
jgi:hypothetical protein